MDRQSMLDNWQIMGIQQPDEDHKTLQAMEQTGEVAWLCDIAEEAKQHFHAWEVEHHPVAVATRNVAPECDDYHNGYQEPI